MTQTNCRRRPAIGDPRPYSSARPAPADSVPALGSSLCALCTGLCHSSATSKLLPSHRFSSGQNSVSVSAPVCPGSVGKSAYEPAYPTWVLSSTFDVLHPSGVQVTRNRDAAVIRSVLPAGIVLIRRRDALNTSMWLGG